MLVPAYNLRISGYNIHSPLKFLIAFFLTPKDKNILAASKCRNIKKKWFILKIHNQELIGNVFGGDKN
jgi:hypothetical protein